MRPVVSDYYDMKMYFEMKCSTLPFAPYKLVFPVVLKEGRKVLLAL